MADNGNSENPNTAALFEAADKLRGSVESAEYKHLVLGLIFLKYVADSFELHRQAIEARLADPSSERYLADAAERRIVVEDQREYTAENVFWIPEAARWEPLVSAALRGDVARRIDVALEEIESANPGLRDVLPKIYSRAPLSADLMGSLLLTVSKIDFGPSVGEARDVLGRTYEYFIREFARAEGHRGGEFFTPACVARLLVEMLQPFDGRIFDPACGSCGLFVQSARFIAAHDGNPDTISVYGQERNRATWRIGRMNLAIHGLSGDVCHTEAGSLLDDGFPSLKADYVVANPPFNQKQWYPSSTVEPDPRWTYGIPPASNANYAWIQHFLHHLAPRGRAGFVLANGSLTASSGGEAEIRAALVRDDVVECVVALPPQLFYTTAIPVCLWFLDRDKRSGSPRDRRSATLFIDARHLGHKTTRTQVELTSAEIERIGATYRAWRGQSDSGIYSDQPGFCKSATLAEIEAGAMALSPGRYVGALPEDDDEVAFAEQIVDLVERLKSEMADNERLSIAVKDALTVMGHAR